VSWKRNDYFHEFISNELNVNCYIILVLELWVENAMITFNLKWVLCELLYHCRIGIVCWTLVNYFQEFISNEFYVNCFNILVLELWVINNVEFVANELSNLTVLLGKGL
jgi:hypothetical protein